MAFIKNTNLVSSQALTIDGLVGGSNNRVVRVSGNNSVTNAGYGDTAAQLNAVLFKSSNTYYAWGLIASAGSFVAGTSYFLDQFGTLTATPPNPTASIRVLYVGFAINGTDLLFKPGIPISG